MKTLFKLILVLVIAAGFFASTQMQKELNTIREEKHLTYNPPLENAPPELVLSTTLLGGFRGIIVDLLWLRAIKLQDEGKYFELVQLFDWICKLEPRLSQIWIYSAWNMAYNISVECPTPEERWNWVRAGIRILRDRGIPYNRKEAILYKELGWIYQHKIGDVMDNFHMYYKNKLAEQMEAVLGPDLDVRKLAEAPQDTAVLLEDSQVRGLVDRLRESGQNVFRQPDLLADANEPSGPSAAMVDVPEEDRESYEKIIAFLRARRLREKYKLDPEYMRGLMNRFGPLDWRHASAHNLYWNSKALDVCDTRKEKQTIRYDRMVYHSLQRIYRQGKVIKVDEGKYVFTTDHRFLDKMREVYEIMIEKHLGAQTILTARQNFYEEAVWILYLNGQAKKAGQYYKFLRENYKEERYKVPLADFVYTVLKDELRDTTRYAAREAVTGYLRQAFWWMASGEEEKSAGYQGMARLIYRKWNSEFDSDRLRLPPFTDLVAEVRKQVEKTFPEVMISRLRTRGVLQ